MSKNSYDFFSIQKNLIEKWDLYKIYEMYDAILGQIISRFKDSRIIICTGLRQLPTQEVIYYWRLKDHEKFFNKLGFKFSRIEPRMSRDFTVVCDSENQAINFQNQIKGIIDQDGDSIFGIADRRGERVYITLTYEKLISKNFKLIIF